MRRLILTLVAGLMATPAFACLNDSELRSHEREFQAQYRDGDYQPPSDDNTTAYIFGGAGVVCAVAGAVVILRSGTAAA